MDIHCELCGKPLDPTSPYVWQRVEGWQRMAGTRASGKYGGSDIALRQTKQAWAHPACVILARDGVLSQETLI